MSNLRNLLFCLLLLVVTDSAGQSAFSPFSAFGIGELGGNGLTHHQGMAGVGVSNPQYWYMNNVNPALLVFNNFTTFEGGLMVDSRTVSNGLTSEKNTGGNMNYLVLSFPIKRTKWTNSIGLSPYSTSNYKLSYSLPIDGSTNTTLVTEEGSGGINRFSWSHGVKLHRTLSVGGRINYLFSSITNRYVNELAQTDQIARFSSSVYQRYHFSDVSFTGSFSFHKDSLFNKNYKFNVGAVYDWKANANTSIFETLERRNLAGILDSTTLRYNEPGRTILPSILTAGISFGKGDRWMVGVDATLSDFTVYRDFDNRNVPVQKGKKLAIGTEFTPDPTSISNYLKRMTYRTGVSFEESPYLINGKPLKDLGINFGLSLPVSRVSSLDVAVRWGKRGNVSDNTIEETYFKIYFGVTFNDQWFIKRRFD